MTYPRALLVLSLAAPAAAHGRKPPALDGGPRPSGSPPDSPSVALVHVTVVDVADGSLRPDQTVRIEGSRIREVGPSASVAVPTDARVVDLRGRYVIPGLWDMHVHSAYAADRELPIYVALGITGVRNMHTTVDTALELTRAIKRRVAAGTLLGPRFLANGAIVDGPIPLQRGAVALGTPDAARATVDSLANGGADFIKVYERLPREVYFAIAEQAKRSGIPFVGHIPNAVRVAEVAEAGQRSIEHVDALGFECSSRGDSIRSIFLSRPPTTLAEYLRLHATLVRSWSLDRCASAIEALRRNGTWFVPTLAVFWAMVNPDSVLTDAAASAVVPADQLQEWRAGVRAPIDAAFLHAGKATVEALQRAGVPLLAGTDVGNPLVIPGYSLHKELELLVAAGLSPLQALRTATLEPARFLEATDSLGSVESGKLADLVILDADPLADIRNTRRIRAVVANGRYFERVALNGLLEAAVSRPDR